MTDSTAMLVGSNKVDALIERSSFGTPGARSLRERTSPALADQLLDRAARGNAASASGRSGGEISSKLRPLVSPAKSGDERATHLVLQHITPVVVRYCRARLGRPFETADRVAEDICLQSCLALPRYDGHDAHFLKEVYQRAVAAVDEAQTQTLPPSGDSTVTEHLMNSSEVGCTLKRLLTELTTYQREVIVLRIVVGLDVRDTAQMLDVSSASVRSAQHRAVAKLRRLLDTEDRY